VLSATVAGFVAGVCACLYARNCQLNHASHCPCLRLQRLKSGAVAADTDLGATDPNTAGKRASSSVDGKHQVSFAAAAGNAGEHVQQAGATVAHQNGTGNGGLPGKGGAATVLGTEVYGESEGFGAGASQHAHSMASNQPGQPGSIAITGVDASQDQAHARSLVDQYAASLAAGTAANDTLPTRQQPRAQVLASHSQGNIQHNLAAELAAIEIQQRELEARMAAAESQLGDFAGRYSDFFVRD